MAFGFTSRSTGRPLVSRSDDAPSQSPSTLQRWSSSYNEWRFAQLVAVGGLWALVLVIFILGAFGLLPAYHL